MDEQNARRFESLLETLATQEATVKLAPEATVVPESARASLRSTEALRQLRVLRTSRNPDDADQDLRLVGTLGEGGMGLIQLANQVALDREVAVKTVLEGRGEAGPTLLQEAFVTGMLEHPNIIPVYTLGRDDAGAPLIVMKRIEGTVWSEVLRSGGVGDEAEPVDLRWHVGILIQVCNALRFAHSREVVHRDIKPENVMIGSFGEVYLLDWGIAISVADEPPDLLPHRSSARGLAGTPAYLAPEMALDDATDIDFRTDVFLLGAVLHEILTGDAPHDGGNLFEVLRAAFECVPKQYDAEVPPELARIAARAMSKAPEDRYQTVEQFRDALADYLSHYDATLLVERAQSAYEEARALDALAADPEARLEFERLTAEARFGFRQALDMWDQLHSAREGLQRCLEMIAEFQLDTRNLTAAAATLRELPTPNVELEQRLQSLDESLREEQEHFEWLKRLEANLDLKTGTTSRSRFVFLVGLLWALSTAWTAHRAGAGDMASDGTSIALGVVRTVGIAAAGILLFRKRLFRNLANRRFMYLIVGVMISIAFFRFIAFRAGVSIEAANALECVLYAFGGAMVGLLADDRRVSVVTALYLVPPFLYDVSHATGLWVLASTHLLVFTSVAVLWSRMAKLHESERSLNPH